MSKVFISYSKQNKDYAQLLTTKLAEEGFEVWIDEVIEPSDNWWRTIRQAIRDCSAFLLIMTPESENSHWVEQELAYALELKKPFFPLLRDGNPNLVHSDVWSRFASIQATDVQQGQLPSYGFYNKLRERAKSAIERSNSLDLMPKPFDWINIPAGKVILGGNNGANGGYITKAKVFEVAAFSIAKYPITNDQFAKFVEARGYQHPEFWTTEGWKFRENERIEEPSYWSDEKRNRENCPVMGVSWYEAIAFCRWLGLTSSENISLPTEQQWQWAAQGDTRWAYPYGDHFDETRCNFNNEATTPVTRYEGRNLGDSPYGVTDMSGNLWEWCLTKYEIGNNQTEGSELRVLRGGSWAAHNIDFLRSDYRNKFGTANGYNLRGFRLIRS